MEGHGPAGDLKTTLSSSGAPGYHMGSKWDMTSRLRNLENKISAQTAFEFLHPLWNKHTSYGWAFHLDTTTIRLITSTHPGKCICFAYRSTFRAKFCSNDQVVRWGLIYPHKCSTLPSGWSSLFRCPDGSVYLSHSENRTLHLQNPFTSEQHEFHQPAPIVDFAWYPAASAKDPATFCFVASVRECPVKLFDASDGRVSVFWSSCFEVVLNLPN